ncbi:MAG: hypothetical protein K8H88_34325 [Sandaracinaceae bacterium]|nr:hypothetical protein [Sandaracinaceae bacterium]
MVEENRGPATEIAIKNRSALKPEHRSLLDLVVADPGMALHTREELVTHLLEEEDEALLQAALRARSTSEGSASPRGPGLTIGSLRAGVHGRPASRGTVGPLNR